jgi:lysophospholipase L1-like esterase
MGRMVVLGDSILWGQGLAEADKFSTLLAQAWSAAAGNAPVDVRRFAHSGADIWDDGQSGLLAAINPEPPPFPGGDFSVGKGAIDQTRASSPTVAPEDGEMPDEEPYLLAQILAAGRLLADQPVDLVLVDMGINDTEIYNLVLPGKSTNAVVRRATSLATRVRFALASIGATFPGAKLLVTGYYPVVSAQTDADEIFQFTRRVIDAVLGAELDIPLGMSRAVAQAERIGQGAGELFDGLFVPELADRCLQWTEATNAMLRQAVADFSAGGRVAAFVDPDFKPEDAIFAPQSLLWAFENGNPTDPMADVRRNLCDARGIVGFERLAAECASLGHPSPEGARRYADAAIGQARGMGLF